METIRVRVSKQFDVRLPLGAYIASLPKAQPLPILPQG